MKYYLGNQIKNNELGTVCGACVEERNVCRLLVGKPEEEDHLADLALYGRIILKLILKKQVGGHGLDEFA